MLDEIMLRKQNKRDKLFVLLFLYNKNMNMKRPTVTWPCMESPSDCSSCSFLHMLQQLTLIDFNCLSSHVNVLQLNETTISTVSFLMLFVAEMLSSSRFFRVLFLLSSSHSALFRRDVLLRAFISSSIVE